MNEYELKIERLQAQVEGQEETIRELEKRIIQLGSLVKVMKMQALDEKVKEMEFLAMLENVIGKELERCGGDRGGKAGGGEQGR